jgi:uncharacterized membrane protein
MSCSTVVEGSRWRASPSRDRRVVALATSARLRNGPPRPAYEALRSNVGRTILLGLEVPIIADIVLTVAEDEIESAVTLAIIVLVRTF